MTAEKQRMAWVDALKAFAISLVILGHCIQFLNSGCGEILYKYIGMIQMPLFMSLSGFCSYKRTVEWQVVSRRFFQLIIPFLCWPVIWYALRLDVTGGLLFYARLLLYPDTGLWFLYCLFLIVVVDVARCRISDKIAARLCDLCEQLADSLSIYLSILYYLSVFITEGVLLGLLGLYKFHHLEGNWLNFVVLYYPYYTLGGMMRRNESIWGARFFSRVGAIGLLVYMVGTYFLSGYLWQMVLASSGIVGAFWVFSRFVNHSLPNIIAFVGSSTLGLYAVHQPLIHYVKHTVVTKPLWMDLVATFLLAFILSMLLVFVLRRYRLTAFLFLGVPYHRFTNKASINIKRGKYPY